MNNEVKDHLGNVYPSINKMCECYGLTAASYRSRRKSGWTLEEALTGNHRFVGRSKECKDHTGKLHNSIKEMCEYWGISVKSYEGRIRRGWTLQETLTGNREIKESDSKTCKDHKGVLYPNALAMCNAWNVSFPAYRWRINNGWTLEEALTNTKVRVYANSKKCKDHLDNHYASISEMCEAWGISKGTYDYRIKCGWTKKDALTIDNFRKCTDHLGKEFSSVAQMCIYWQVTRDAYEKRINNGWTLEEALTNSKVYVHNTAKPCQDHMGNEFATIDEMIHNWGITRGAFDSRIKNGWTLEEALTIPKQFSLGEYRISSILRDYQVAGYFDCYHHDITIKKVFTQLNQSGMYERFLEEYEKELISQNISINRDKISKFRFDFSLIKNDSVFAFIEYDGEQHFQYVEIFFNTLNQFLFRQKADIAKNVFAETNTIPLLRIRYDQVDDKKIRYMIEDLLSNPDKYIEKHNTFLDNDEYMRVYDKKKTKFSWAY